MVPDLSPNMTERSDEATGFFSLPRELRDKIYDMVREDRCIKVGDVIFDFRAAVAEKRLVSRQFKSEYDERSPFNTFVRVFDVLNLCTFEQFPRLAIKSCYLELCWTSEDPYDTASPVNLSAPVPISLGDRMRSLQRLVGNLHEIKYVHVKLLVHGTHNLKDIVDELIACPALTSFSVRDAGFFLFRQTAFHYFMPFDLTWVPWSLASECVDFAIWSREHGFLIDNTDEEKAKQEVKAASERYERREAAKTKSREADSSLLDTPDFSGTGQNSRDGAADEESP